MAFTPADLNGTTLKAWYDASHAASITGSPVSAFADRSSNAFNLSQGTAGRRPGTGAVTLNGLNVLTFDGGDDLVAASAADWKFLHDGTAWIMVAVVKFGTGSAVEYGLFGTNALGSASHGASCWYTDVGALDQAFVNFISRGVAGQPPVNNTTANDSITKSVWHIVAVAGDPDHATPAMRSGILIDGAMVQRNNTNSHAVSSSNPTYAFALGSGGNFVLPGLFDFGEMVITSSWADLTNVHTYLSAKWGLGRPYHLDLLAPNVVIAA